MIFTCTRVFLHCATATCTEVEDLSTSSSTDVTENTVCSPDTTVNQLKPAETCHYHTSPSLPRLTLTHTGMWGQTVSCFSLSFYHSNEAEDTNSSALVKVNAFFLRLDYGVTPHEQYKPGMGGGLCGPSFH